MWTCEYCGRRWRAERKQCKSCGGGQPDVIYNPHYGAGVMHTNATYPSTSGSGSVITPSRGIDDHCHNMR